MTISAYQLDQSPKPAFDFFAEKSALNQRVAMRGSIARDLDVGAQEVVPEKEVFYEGALYLQDADARVRDDLGGLFWAAPLRTRGREATKLPGPNVEALPIRDRAAVEDDRWAPTAFEGPGLFWPCGSPPGGTIAPPAGQSRPTKDRQAATLLGAPVAGQHPGLVVRGTEERSQHLLFAPTWANVLTSNHRGRRPSLYSTLLADLDGEDLADGQAGRDHWMASLDTGAMVIPTYRNADPTDPGKACGLGLFWGNEPWQPDGAGRGLFASHGPFGKQALSYAFAADSGGGPITCGGGVFDKHAVHLADDGRLISQGHLWLKAPWFLDETRDAPPEVDTLPYEPPETRGRPWKTYLRYDPRAQHETFGPLGRGGVAPGLFKWETYVPLYMPPDPPPEPPPLEDPIPPLGGGGMLASRRTRERVDRAQKWGIRTALHSYLEVATSAQVFRARHTGLSDLRYQASPSQRELDEIVGEAPMALRSDVIGAQRGSTWTYTQKPRGRSRYEAGTVSGGLWYMPPELDSDLAGSTSLPPTSTSYLGLWESRLAMGTPDPSTGGISNGFYWDLDGSNLTLYRVTSGTATERMRLSSVGALSQLSSVDATSFVRAINRLEVGDPTAFDPGSVRFHDGAFNLDLEPATRSGGSVDLTLPWRSGTLATLEGDQTFTGALTFEDDIVHQGSEAGFFGATPVTQPGAITNPSGGAIIDSQARTAIIAILGALRTLGLIAT